MRNRLSNATHHIRLAYYAVFHPAAYHLYIVTRK